ncbi:hypothetical protein [Gimesia aquarii]|uniref:Lipoprotein n=1 Tax=Gimesia aquarii TaxID=2527964 RepID=A0A517WQ21_9PLAN|nr:hypothetical protein [Gimesia aquarii]QDU07326.1 hypothetical protein V202x_06780 [Gimesia aquarii]
MRSSSRNILILGLIILTSGCMPGVKVKKNPTDRDTGIRYYRPKPYLLITPSSVKKTLGTGPTQTSETSPSDQFVEMKLDYLPDFSEEYSINVKTGFGTADVQIKLEDGWNLTSINQNLDSKTNENISAAADLVTAFGNVAKPTSLNSSVRGKEKWVVKATNVPLGYYESVIGPDPYCSNKKRLYGWRYVGFAPFNYCPTDICGSKEVYCNDGRAAIYGLTFNDGVMVFSPLGLISYESGSEMTLVPFGDIDDTVRIPQSQKEELQSKIKKKILESISDLELGDKLNVNVELDQGNITKVTLSPGNLHDYSFIADSMGKAIASVKENVEEAVGFTGEVDVVKPMDPASFRLQSIGFE